MSDESLVEESLSTEIGVLKRKIDDTNNIRKVWENTQGQKKSSCYSSNKVPDSDFNNICKAINGMKRSEKYNEYKKHFEALGKLCYFNISGCMITNYKLKRGSNNKNSVYISYTNNRKKITIPNNSKLYHMSTVEGIRELKPFFKGKAAKGYMYDYPRIYFTIRKDMMKFCADIKPNEKTHLYTPKENIRTAYVDPLVGKFFQGAVYIETMFPIRVDDVQKMIQKRGPLTKEKIIKESEVIDMNEGDLYNEEPNFVSLEEFMDYYGLEFANDDELMEESFSAKIGELSRKIDDKKSIKNTWKEKTTNIKHNSSVKYLAQRDYDKLKKDYSVMAETKLFPVYKRSYESICRVFGVSAKDTLIEHIWFNDNDKEPKKKVELRYSKGRQKVIIPNGSCLLHVTPVKGIKELIPAFRSKTKGVYLYPTKRVYFTIGKQVSRNKAGLEGQENKLHKYTPRENFRTAYIDPALTNFKTGAIYIDTGHPIPVKELDDENKTDIKKESVTNLKLNIYDAYENDIITESEKDLFLNCIDSFEEE